jgi:UDP-N-acetylglucosamine 2-epimerase (non-hydrolysing)
MKHITIIAGARPNFMKIAPIIHAIQAEKAKGTAIDFALVHTGQHFDEKMSGSFFHDLEIPAPTINLEAGGGTQAEQTAAIMVGFERYLLAHPTNLVLVVGDVTSTMACAIVAQKLHTPVAHVEGGIRSNDWTMPEEINRLVTDAITNYFFTTSEIANENLRKAGIGEEKIFFVGNTMIDTLLKQKPRFHAPDFWETLGLQQQGYLVMTLHRPGNVDNPENLKHLLEEILAHTGDLMVVFPVHPRTRKVLDQLGFNHPKLMLVEPQSYLKFNYLVMHCKAVITDSGGITEEATVLNKPCMTLRSSTERPETVTLGSNELVGTDPKALQPFLEKLLAGNWKSSSIPPLWDGHTAERIVQIVNHLPL